MFTSCTQATKWTFSKFVTDTRYVTKCFQNFLFHWEQMFLIRLFHCGCNLSYGICQLKDIRCVTAAFSFGSQYLFYQTINGGLSKITWTSFCSNVSHHYEWRLFFFIFRVELNLVSAITSSVWILSLVEVGQNFWNILWCYLVGNSPGYSFLVRRKFQKRCRKGNMKQVCSRVCHVHVGGGAHLIIP